jgi:predicted amidohydrolase YtcJ
VADRIYTNGRIYTVNDAQPWAEALAIKDGVIVAIGSAGEEMAAVTDEDTEGIDQR